MSNARPTVCPFCSMGCTLLLVHDGDSPYYDAAGAPTLEYDRDGDVNRGSLCARGNMALELLTHPGRIDTPLVRDGSTLRPVGWPEALDAVQQRLQTVLEAEGPRAVGILVGPHLTNEEASLAARLARTLGTNNVDACLAEDRTALLGAELAGASPEPIRSPEEIEGMTAMLLVGDVFTLAPCLSRSVLAARYDRRQNVLAVLDGKESRTTWFAKPMLRCRPAREAAALALLLRRALDRMGPGRAAQYVAARAALGKPEMLQGLCTLDPVAADSTVDALAKAERAGVIFAAGFAARERDILACGLAALLAQATRSRFLAVTTGSNTRGVWRALRNEGSSRLGGLTCAEMIEAAVTKDLKALLVLGCDPLSSLPDRVPVTAMRNLDLLVFAGPLGGRTGEIAHVLLPTCAWGEKSGTAQNMFGQDRPLGAALEPPGAARSEAEILTDLVQRFGGDSEEETNGQPPADRGGLDFFDELDLYFRLVRRATAAPEAGTHLLLPRALPAHAGDGWWTRELSWPRHESPHACVFLAPVFAAQLGTAEGDKVQVRSRAGEATLRVRVERRLPPGVVLAPPHYPEIRRLVSWRMDPMLNDLDLAPERVSVEPCSEVDRG